jgi:thymidylate synthase ThyX
MIKAEIVADSKNEFGNRITTMVVTMPRIILAEFNTHRMFSRNSASSRAIPFEKIIKSVNENPFIPLAFQKDHKGMQGNQYLTNELAIDHAKKLWLKGRDYAVESAEAFRCLEAIDTDYLTDFEDEEDILLTKQLANRGLETYMYHTVIVTATEWENFFALRCPQYHSPEKYMTNPPKPVKIYRSWKDMTQDYLSLEQDASILTKLSYNKGQAEIHMMALAEAMWDAYNESVPKLLQAGEWHLPYNDKIVEMIKEDGTKLFPYPADLYDNEIESTDGDEWATKYKIQASNMMAARTSYTVVGQDQKPWTFDKYVEEGTKLETANPLHASPLEHCAQCMDHQQYQNSFVTKNNEVIQQGVSGNFTGGWLQYRKMFANENKTK